MPLLTNGFDLTPSFSFHASTMLIEILRWYFKGRLEELSAAMADESKGHYDHLDSDEMDVDEKNKMSSKSGGMDIDGGHLHGDYSENKLVRSIGKVVRDLRGLGFISMAEDAYAAAIFLLLKVNMCLVMPVIFFLVVGNVDHCSVIRLRCLN